MTEIPEHLLQRSRERRKALGLPVPGEEGGEAAPTEAAASETTEPVEAPAAAAAETPAPAPAAAGGPPITDVELPGGGRIPAHLLQRSRDRRIALGLEVPGAPAGGGAAGAAEVPAAAGGARAAAATATLPAPTVTGPGGHTQRLLTVVKSGSIQETRAEAQDKVHTWPHLLVVEFAALLIVTAGTLIFSAL